MPETTTRTREQEQEIIKKAESAIRYLLNRIKSEPKGVGYHIGIATETYDRLCRALAVIEGKPVREIAERFIEGSGSFITEGEEE